MHGHNLVAVFSSRSDADAARERLLTEGVAQSDIRVSADHTTASTTTAPPKHEGGFFDWLFGDVPAEQQTWYATNLREGRTAVSVYVRDQNHEQVRDLLEEFNPMDIDDTDVGTAQIGSRGAETQTLAKPIVGQAHPESAPRTADDRDQVIPLAKEELDVGKRQTERRYKIRTYVVEKPVEEQVHLRDERVTIERRPVSGDRSAAVDGLQGREFEVIERHEEPVVAKKSGAAEEVLVHKEVTDRIETIRDKVRETKVDIDKGTASGTTKVGVDRAAAGAKPGSGSDLK
jgi:stress response protein YsnF